MTSIKNIKLDINKNKIIWILQNKDELEEVMDVSLNKKFLLATKNKNQKIISLFDLLNKYYDFYPKEL